MAAVEQSAGPAVSSEPLKVALENRAFGRYRLRTRIARGGMATVYLAEHRTHEGFRKWLAIKIIHPHFADDPAFIAMFHDEARLAARIDHPNICTVFDFGRVDDTYYIAMEYLQGEPLGNVIRRGGRGGHTPLEIAVGVVIDAARGLHAAHQLVGPDGEHAGVVHRDVSPQNIFVLASGQSKVVDFGVARFNDRVQRTVAQAVKGKPGYLSPEQISGSALDRRADIFSLGVVLWESLTSSRLFREQNEAATMASVLTKTVPPPSDIESRVPRALDEIALKALTRDPTGRFQTADEMASALERFAREWSEPVGTRQTSEWMHEAFKPEIAARDELLQRLARSPDQPVAPIDSDPVSDGSTTPPATVTDAATISATPRSRRRRGGWWVAVTAGALLATAALTVLALKSNVPSRAAADRSVQTPRTATEAAPTARTAPAPIVSPRQEQAVLPNPPPPTVAAPPVVPSEAHSAHASVHHEARHGDSNSTHSAPLRPMHAYPGGT